MDKMMLIPGLVDAPRAAGQIALANEGAFANTFLSEPLTDYACGWTSEQKKLENLLDFMAPGVKVAHRFEYRKASNADQFALVENVERALYGEFAKVQSLGEIVQAKTISKGLTTVIEKDSEQAGDREAKVAWLKAMLLRADIKAAYAALNAAATNTAKTWGSGTSATPDADVATAIDAFGDAVGIDATRVLFGSTAWQKRRIGFSAKATADAMANYGFTPEALAGWLGVDGVLVSNERYTSGSGKAKLATTNQVMVFAGAGAVSQEDPSTLKRFWTPETAGGEWAVYVDEVSSPKLVKITVAHTSAICATCSTGVQKLTIS